MTQVELYDATLRDGMGSAGITLTAEEKVRIVHRLDELGVHLIEAGFPASNPKEAELFDLLGRERFQQTTIAAFGMTRRRDTAADADAGLRVLAESFAPVTTIVGKTSVLHVEKVIRVSREENLAMIAESVAFLVAQGKRVLLDAEHFFDGYADDPAFSLDCLRAAADAGAERLVLCDTNGGSLPGRIHQTVSAVRAALPDVKLGIHTHNDTDCAVANSLVAVEAGATHVQGTLNGVGERTGNANLVSCIAGLQLTLGIQVISDEQLAHLTQTAHFADELFNRAPNPNQPWVGKNAFAHKAGLHAAGVRTESAAFEHVDPALVGNRNDVLVEQRADGKVETEATIKIWVDGERFVRTAEGNGPVNALDAALRSAITDVHPHLRDIELVNFKVRILDETKGTDAVTRVLLDASDGDEVWGSIGVHENIIAASWQALVDSLEHAMQPGKPQHTRAAATT
jgi:2-isopropylmalate synthase